ncbi:MAG: hypothetical protein N2C12_14170 [Planctomycetales bacterium]
MANSTAVRQEKDSPSRPGTLYFPKFCFEAGISFTGCIDYDDIDGIRTNVSTRS